MWWKLGVALVSLSLLGACKIKVREGLEDFSSSVSALSFEFSPHVSYMTRESPAVSVSASADGRPVILGTLDRIGSITFYSDNKCRTDYGTVTTDQSKNFRFEGIQFTVDGTYSIYYRTYDFVRKVWSSCENSNLGYRYQAVPILSFSRTAYTVKDNGNAIGSVIEVTRDVGGVANSVTVALEELTARDTTHMNINTLAFSFSADDSDLSQETSTAMGGASVGYLGVVDTHGAADVDRYFIARINDPGVGGAIGSTSIAQVNYIDTDTTGEYFFTHSFYSSTDSSSAASLVVQRMTTGAPATVNISFVDGSAIGGTDYASSTVTANFGAGDAEATVSVPIYNVSSNKSFFAKIDATLGTQVRPQSIAKVRILDSAESTTCTSFAGAGTSLSPYQICTTDAFADLPNQDLGAHYKLMADIVDLNGDWRPLSGFTGSFDGNEHTISKFNYSGTGAGDNSNGLFRSLGNATVGGSTIQNLNLLYYQMTNVDSRVGGLVGVNGDTISLHPAILKNIHASGYVSGLTQSVGGLVGKQNCTLASTSSTFENILNSGHITAGSTIGGLAGEVDCSSVTAASFTLQKAFNTMSSPPGVFNAGSYGGIMGSLISTGTATTYTFSTLENRGTWNSDSSTGGLFGVSTVSGTQTFTGLKNYGPIQNDGSDSAGGIFGSLYTRGNTTVTNAQNYGVINNNSNVSGGVAGTAGMLNANATLQFSSVENYGAVSAVSGTAAGIVGILGASVSTTTFSISNATNSGLITSPGYVAGILGNISATGGPTGQSYTIDSATNTGNLVSTGAYTGGILGGTSPTNTGGANSIVISNSTNTNTITGTTSVGGIIGDFNPTANFGTVTLSNVTATVALTSSSTNAGGIMGRFNLGGAGTIATVNITNAVAAGTISSTTGVGGILGTAVVRNATSGLTITGANSDVDITETVTAGSTGGIVGSLTLTTNPTATISASKFTGSITSTVAGSTQFGGIVGYISGAGDVAITQSYAIANLTGAATSSRMGGIVGFALLTGAASNLDITKCYFSGNLYGSFQIGGIFAVGNFTDATVAVTNTYTTGTYTSAAAVNGNMGSFFGQYSSAGAASVALSNSYSLAVLSPNGAGNVKGIIGSTGVPTVTNSFWRKDGVYNTAIAADGNEKTDAQLQLSATFTGAGWDLGATAANIWQILTYPFLSGMP